MSRRTTRTAVLPVLSLALVLFVSFVAAAESEGNLEALDYAFQFATAIHPDPKDQSMAQHLAVVEYIAVDALAEATAAAKQMKDWRRGTAYADIAAAYGWKGDRERAGALIGKAEAVRGATDGWQKTRIHSHIARALAALGRVEEVRGIVIPIGAADRVYSARGVAMIAEALSVQGDYEKAMEALASLEEDRDIYDTWWRTEGYLALTRSEKLSKEQKAAAVDAARAAADRIEGWKRAEALLNVAGKYSELDFEDRALECLESADEISAGLPATMTARPMMLSALAHAWVEIGRKEHALDLLGGASGGIEAAMSIDRPGMYAALAAGYHAAGAGEDARRLFDRALAETEGLANARPRALAAADVCRSMGRFGYSLDEATKSRLDALLAGLGDPW